jgi:hypothetical protein
VVANRGSPSLATALELADLAARMVEARFRREHPHAAEPEVEAHVRAWWLDRPGAPSGDGVGPTRPIDTVG